MSKRINVDEFFKKCSEVHGGKYVYHNDYVSMKDKILITCPIHGDFYQEPRHHINGCGCKECSHKSTKYTNEEFLAKAREVHGDKYTYLDEYVGRDKKIRIECPVHGIFLQKPYSHLSGSGCPKCAELIRADKLRMSIDEFIEKARKVHDDKYDYNRVENYENNLTKVPIVCPEHGVFYQTVNKHLMGCGCPLCCGSKMEENVSAALSSNGINFIPQYNLVENKRQKFDFYIPEYNVAIECQGEQHFKPIEYFGGVDEFSRRNELDKNKKEFCEKNGIKLLYYSDLAYNEFLGKEVHHAAEKLINEIKS